MCMYMYEYKSTHHIDIECCYILEHPLSCCQRIMRVWYTNLAWNNTFNIYMGTSIYGLESTRGYETTSWVRGTTIKKKKMESGFVRSNECVWGFDTAMHVMLPWNRALAEASVVQMLLMTSRLVWSMPHNPKISTFGTFLLSKHHRYTLRLRDAMQTAAHATVCDTRARCFFAMASYQLRKCNGIRGMWYLKDELLTLRLARLEHALAALVVLHSAQPFIEYTLAPCDFLGYGLFRPHQICTIV